MSLQMRSMPNTSLESMLYSPEFNSRMAFELQISFVDHFFEGVFMKRLKKKIEAQLQEIVFFFSLIVAFTVFVSGMFFLALSADNIVYVLGSVGSMIVHSSLSAFGLAFFYVSVMALHLGYITNIHVYRFADFKNEYHILSYSALAHIIILTLLSAALAVTQIYFNGSASENLNYGIGGFVGLSLAQALYHGMGLYGSLLILTIAAFAASIVANFFELRDVQNIVYTLGVYAKRGGINLLNYIQDSLLHLFNVLFKQNKLAYAHHQMENSKNWISQSVNKANNFVSEGLQLSRGVMSKLSFKKENQKSADIQKISLPVKKVIHRAKAATVKKETKQDLSDVKKKSVRSSKTKTAPVKTSVIISKSKSKKASANKDKTAIK